MGTAVAAPAHLAKEHVRIAVQALGANALSSVRVIAPDAGRRVRAPEISLDATATLDGLPRTRTAKGAQPSLFGAELQPRIIPFEDFSRPKDSAPEPVANIPGPTALRPPAKPVPRKTRRVEEAQATLDFLPPLKNTARTLKTNADAVIFCDAVVAAPIHRAAAAALDLSMILIAFASIVLVFRTATQPAVLSRGVLVCLCIMLGLTAFLYGLLFAIAGTVTPGMRWAQLRLINFDGFPLDGRNRALRFVGAWISVLSGGIGLLWALLDEENLTWHDHMSKSFPTLRESDSIVVRQRLR